MIHVDPAPEPPDFQHLVRRPGQQLLLLNPAPKSDEFKPFWRNILPSMRHAYRSICAYSGQFVPYTTGNENVEHYLAKTTNPHLAYEWSNYRYVCGRLNGRKGTHTDVLDPFVIQTGWFILVFPATLVKPADNLPEDVSAAVLATIQRLRLNEDNQMVDERFSWVKEYCDGHITFDFLSRRAPFIALELQRQGLVHQICAMVNVI